MAYELGKQNLSLNAGADFSTAQFLGLVVSSEDVASIAGADATIIGVLQNTPPAGAAAGVTTNGATKAVAGGAVTAGDLVGTDANGKFVTGASVTVGIALTDAAAADCVFTIELD